jgi:hypothetical protein
MIDQSPDPTTAPAPAPVIDPAFLDALAAALAARQPAAAPALEAGAAAAPGAVPTAPAPRPADGDLVRFQFLDTVTGNLLSGPAVVVSASTSGTVKVAPLSTYLIDVDVAQLAALGADELAPNA